MLREMKPCRGVTLVELLVVMAIISSLLAIAVPRYLGTLDKAREAVLRENLWTMRDVIDKFYSDTGNYPATLDQLVLQKYLRVLPVDPMTGNNRSWVTVAPDDTQLGGVSDIRSGSPARALDGSLYRDW